MKLDKLLCYMFLLPFLASTCTNHSRLEPLTNRNVPVKTFNFSVKVKTKNIVHGGEPLNINCSIYVINFQDGNVS